MKSTILLSIHPCFAEKIISGEKKYEYRKIIPSVSISRIAIYSTWPIKKIVALVDVINEIQETPSKLWERTSKRGGITRVYYRQYFHGRKCAYAFEFGVVTRITPIALNILDMNTPPQSFRYLSNKELEIIQRYEIP